MPPPPIQAQSAQAGWRSREGGLSTARNAGVAELVDAPDLGSGIARCGGSSPLARTTLSHRPPLPEQARRAHAKAVMADDSKLSIYAALAGNVAVAAVKFGAFALSGSSAMLA